MKKEIKLTVGKLLFILLIMLVFNVVSSQATTNYAISANKIGYTDNFNLGADNVQAAIDGTCTKFSSQLTNLKNEVKTETINEMYPVGSVYISTSISNAKDVATTLGVGTWESYAQGRTLVGVGTGTDSNDISKIFKIDAEGGEYSHTLTTSEIPSHSHTIPSLSGTAASTGSGYSLSHTCPTKTTSESGTHSHGFTTGGYAMVIEATSNYKNYDKLSGFASATVTAWWSNSNKNIAHIANAGAHTHTYQDCYLNGLSGVEAHTHTVSTTASTTGKVGKSEAHNNIQPYITVYMYKRTS